MKLEIKHLAGYLPYGLKIKSMNDIVYTMCDKGGLSNLAIADLIDNPELYTPILRPLSDLTKVIEVNKEKFVPSTLGLNLPLDNLISEEILKLKYTTVQKLLEWHFDIFGLIENGLAVDINTLEL